MQILRELYELKRDLEERLSLYDEHPAAAEIMGSMQAFFRKNAVSRPGYEQPIVRP